MEELFKKIPELKAEPKQNALEKSGAIRPRISLTEGEVAELEPQASFYHLPVPWLIKWAAFAYFRQDYLVPDLELVRELKVEIAAIGNNINQLVRHCHKAENLTPVVIAELTQELRRLDQLITEALTKPKKKS